MQRIPPQFGTSYQLKNQRPYQQDYVLYSNWSIGGSQVHVFGVLDGHGTGGEIVSREAAALLVKFLKKNLVRIGTGGEDGYVKKKIRLSFRETQEYLLLDPNHQNDHRGTTAVICLLFRNTIYTANVGDSRAILCCPQPPYAIALSRDHKPNTPEEKERIESLGGKVYTDQGVARVLLASGVGMSTSRSLGDTESRFSLDSSQQQTQKQELPLGQYYLSPDPEISYTNIYRKGSPILLILASDGIWDVLSTDDVCRIFTSMYGNPVVVNPSLEACKLVAKEAKKRGSGDNITVIGLRLQ